MAKVSGKNSWVLLLLMLCGIVVGSFVGYITKDMMEKFREAKKNAQTEQDEKDITNERV